MEVTRTEGLSYHTNVVYHKLLGCNSLQPKQSFHVEQFSSAPPAHFHSHSIVPGGLLVTSYTTRLMPLTSLTMRLEMVFSTSCGSGTQSAVMPSSECTARMAQVYAYVRMSPITPTDITGNSTANDCHPLLYSPARLISVTTMSSASCSRATRSAV